MQIEQRHHLAAAALTGISWTMVTSRGFPAGAFYVGMFFMAFGVPAYCLTRMVLARRAGIAYSIRRKRP